jgi:hypothetical protein
MKIIIPSNAPERVDRCLRSMGGFYRQKVILLAGPELMKCLVTPAVRVVAQQEPFCFAHEINEGIHRAGSLEDVLILNDDTVVSPEAIHDLEIASLAHGGKCILSPGLTGRITVEGAWKRTDDLVPERGMKERRVQWIPFFCAYIPSEARRVIRESPDQANIVGDRDLDERFVAYGGEDDDYCYRARRANIPVIVLPNITIHHGWPNDDHEARWGEKRRRVADGQLAGMDIFRDKWRTAPAPDIDYPPDPVPHELAQRVAWAEKIPGWMGHDELTWLAIQSSTRSSIVEFGSFKGRSAKALASTPGKLYCVDQFNHDNTEREFPRYMSADIQSKRVEMVRCKTWQADRWLRDRKIRPDMIFIDAGHDWRSVRDDIRMCQDLIAPGGLLCGHDFNPPEFPGVCLAVKELVPDYQLPLGSSGSIWMQPPRS